MNETYMYTKLKGHHRSNKDGYVYEHILVAETLLGRKLYQEEVVHHIDHNRRNNNIANIMVFSTNADHMRFHKTGKAKMDSKSNTWTSPIITHSCIICGKETQADKFCSQECAHMNQRKVERPSCLELEHMLLVMSFRSIGRRYNVSDNTIRKWAKAYDLI